MLPYIIVDFDAIMIQQNGRYVLLGDAGQVLVVFGLSLHPTWEDEVQPPTDVDLPFRSKGFRWEDTACSPHSVSVDAG